MSATLISNNTTIKISSAVSATATVNNNTLTVYSCSANSYAILNVMVTSNSASSASVSAGGRTVKTYGSGISDTQAYTIYLGPSQALQVTSGSVANTVCVASGVEFINTP